MDIKPLAPADGKPAFEEAWQAEVLALAYALSERGVFSPTEWSGTLGAELQRMSARGEADDRDTYYRAALAAIERLIAKDGRISLEAFADRTEQWRRAYLNTPHGKPVELSAGADDAPGRHSHSHHP